MTPLIRQLGTKLYGIISQKTIILICPAMKTTNHIINWVCHFRQEGNPAIEFWWGNLFRSRSSKRGKKNGNDSTLL